MLPDAPVFAVFLAAGVTLTITPGPDMIYVASRALGQGRAAGVLSTFGVITGIFVHLGLASLGLAELFRHAPWAYDLVRYLGAAYLLYLAWRVASARDDPGFTAARGNRAGRARIYVQGLTTNLLNPKVALTAGGLGDWLRRHPRVQRVQAWVTASILAGLALRIALPENR